MEKQRIRKFIKSGRRLLVILLTLLFAGQAFSQTISWEQIRQLRITPDEGQALYTKNDIRFSVTIPNARPSQVQVLSTEQKSDISFRTIRKSDNYENNGTTIEIWYSFSKKGSYRLNPLSVMIQNRRRSIDFNPVTITDDPAKMNPRIVLTFTDGTIIYSDEPNNSSPLFKIQTGKKLNFTVNLQYATQLMQFSWDIPKDSIFTRTQEFEFTEVRYRERTYTHDLIPVAEFEWTGLVPGVQRIPVFHLTATGYSGARTELILPEFLIEFVESESDETSDNSTDIFSDAFYQEEEPQPLYYASTMTKEECRTLANYYTKEHNEFLLYLKARRMRINFEESCGLVVSPNPIFPTVFLYLALILIIVSIICIIFACRNKHKIRILLFTTLLLIGIAVLIFCAVKRNEHYGISSGCKIYSIPQINAESVSEIDSGIRVRILERTGKWYYIEVGESGGWCSIEDIFLIK